MKKIKTILFVSLMVLTMSTLAACGNSNTKDNNSAIKNRLQTLPKGGTEKRPTKINLTDTYSASNVIVTDKSLITMLQQLISMQQANTGPAGHSSKSRDTTVSELRGVIRFENLFHGISTNVGASIPVDIGKDTITLCPNVLKRLGLVMGLAKIIKVKNAAIRKVCQSKTIDNSMVMRTLSTGAILTSQKIANATAWELLP